MILLISCITNIFIPHNQKIFSMLRKLVLFADSSPFQINLTRPYDTNRELLRV